MHSYQEVDEQLIVQALTSVQAYQTLSHLCQEYGSRFAGTEEEERASRYLSSCMKEYGLERVQRKPFSYPGWRRGSSRLFLVQNGSWKELDTIGLPYSPSGTVEAPVVDVGDGTPEEFAALGQEIKGRIVLLSARQPVFRQESMHRRDKYIRAVEAGAVAFLWMREQGGHLEETGSLPHDAPIPGVGISRETGFIIQEAISQGALVCLQCENKRLRVESFNVVGTIPGSSSGSLLVGAHYDGHDIASGALDNGAGTAVLLETARLLNPFRDHLLSRITFVCFAAEEVGLLGSSQYVKELGDERLDFMINLDAGAGRPGMKLGLSLQNFPELIPCFKEIFSRMGEDRIVALHPSAHSDMYSFSQAGIPSGYFKDMEKVPTGRSFGHTRADTLDKVDRRKLQEDALLLARFLFHLSSQPWPSSDTFSLRTGRSLC